MMLERSIFQVLTAGRELINENKNFLRQYFQDSEQGPGLSDAEVEQIVTLWEATKAIDADSTEQVGVSIIHQFPRDSTLIPCWAIVLLDEREDQQFLGSEAGYLGDNGEDVFSSIWAKSYAVFTYARNPLTCLYYYELSKFFLLRGREFLKSPEGGSVLTYKFSGGDMSPDPRYSPAELFVRRLQIDVSREERVLGDPQIRATRVRGIHVSEGIGDAIGVKAEITIAQDVKEEDTSD
jgi:hypothetical protein